MTQGSYHGMKFLQCVPIPPVPLAPWYQRNSWIFIIVAVVAAAILVAMAWCVEGWALSMGSRWALDGLSRWEGLQAAAHNCKFACCHCPTCTFFNHIICRFFFLRRAGRPQVLQNIIDMRKRLKGIPTSGTVSVVVTDIEDFSGVLT